MSQTIKLTNEEAKLFKLFREFQGDFEIMLKAKVFEFKNGRAVLYKDKDGRLRKITVDKVSYKC